MSIGDVGTVVEANGVVPSAIRGHNVHGGGKCFAGVSSTYTFCIAGA